MDHEGCAHSLESISFNKVYFPSCSTLLCRSPTHTKLQCTEINLCWGTKVVIFWTRKERCFTQATENSATVWEKAKKIGMKRLLHSVLIPMTQAAMHPSWQKETTADSRRLLELVAYVDAARISGLAIEADPPHGWAIQAAVVDPNSSWSINCNFPPTVSSAGVPKIVIWSEKLKAEHDMRFSEQNHPMSRRNNSGPAFLLQR